MRRRTLIRGAAAIGATVALTAGTALPAAAHGSHDGHGSPTQSYVALGDSYTSGPLIPVQVDANCLRSSSNYPNLVTQGLRRTALTDVSCSGATTAEMWQAQGTNPPQLDAVTKGTDLVTLQIGGNDIGFGTIIGTCAYLAATAPTGSPCKAYYNASGTDQLETNIALTVPKVAAVLKGIHQRAPHARVVVVGYPDLLPDSGVGCRPSVPFADGDFGYLKDSEKKLNAMLATQARAAHATYVDTYTPTIGHDMCTAPGVRWIEPLTPASPAAPAHPNALGEQAMAAAVLDRLCVRGSQR